MLFLAGKNVQPAKLNAFFHKTEITNEEIMPFLVMMG